MGITRRASREVSGGVRNTLDGVVRAEPGDSRSETSPRGLHQELLGHTAATRTTSRISVIPGTYLM